ncbi:MAG: transposase [Alphaproteobacteria bacterium]|jgi:transposase-like protein|nr:transposase [Alphaproteobacteria bacterium]
MPRRHRSHSIDFKRQIVAEYHAGETLYGLAKRHDFCRNLIRVWIEKAEAGAFDDEVATADMLATYEAKIAALERLVGRQALEIEFLKGAVRSGPLPRSAPTSVISGPVGSRSDPSLRPVGRRLQNRQIFTTLREVPWRRVPTGSRALGRFSRRRGSAWALTCRAF